MALEKNRSALAAAALLALAALAFYNYLAWPLQASDGPTVEQLARNKYYGLEGRNVTLLYAVVRKIDLQAGRITVSEPAGQATVEAELPQEILLAMQEGDFVAVRGNPEFERQGESGSVFLRGNDAHVYQNLWWRPLVSLLALALVACVLWKEKPWKKQML